jgi:hypothetical protein
LCIYNNGLSINKIIHFVGHKSRYNEQDLSQEKSEQDLAQEKSAFTTIGYPSTK